MLEESPASITVQKRKLHRVRVSDCEKTTSGGVFLFVSALISFVDLKKNNLSLAELRKKSVLYYHIVTTCKVAVTVFSLVLIIIISPGTGNMS